MFSKVNRRHAKSSSIHGVTQRILIKSSFNVHVFVDTFACPQMHLDTWLIFLIHTKNPTSLRQLIKESLAVTLCYLASYDSQKWHSWSYRIGKTTISKKIEETSKAIWEDLHDVYLKPPLERYQTISDEFGIFHTVLKQLMENMLPSNVSNYLGYFTLITKDFLVFFCSQFEIQQDITWYSSNGSSVLRSFVYIRLLRKTAPYTISCGNWRLSKSNTLLFP